MRGIRKLFLVLKKVCNCSDFLRDVYIYIYLLLRTSKVKGSFLCVYVGVPLFMETTVSGT